MTSATVPKTSAAAAEITALLQELQRHQSLQLRPHDFRVYKASKGNGTALKVDLRLEPEWQTSDAGTAYVRGVDGGLFLELAAETGVDPKGNPTFNWKDKTHRVGAKFGLPDISAMLVAFREVRIRGKKVPDGIQPKRKSKDTGKWESSDPSGTTLGMTHKFTDSKTGQARYTIISYKFEESGGHLHISEGADRKRSIKLTLTEELQLQAYLEHAMRQFLLLGL